MIPRSKILGCFVSDASVSYDDPEELKTKRSEQSAVFRGYVWGKDGVFDKLGVLGFEKYGQDLELILFQFYTNPLEIVAIRLREVEYYRRKERAIGVSVVVNERNFFNGSEMERQDFLRDIIVTKLELLGKTVKRGKLDTNIDLLQQDVKKLLGEWRV